MARLGDYLIIVAVVLAAWAAWRARSTKKQTTRIEHMVNSERDKMLDRIDNLERKLATRTRQRDDAEEQLPGSRILRPEEEGPHPSA